MRRSHDAVLFDLDGVLTSTTALHIECWKRALDEVLLEWAKRTGTRQPAFDAKREYLALLDGKPRNDVRDFLRARGIDAPEGRGDSPAEEWSVHGISNRKQGLVERALAGGAIEAFPGSIRWVEHLRAAGLRTAVVSSSTNAQRVLQAAGISDLFDLTVDGGVSSRSSACVASRSPTGSSRRRRSCGSAQRARWWSRTRLLAGTSREQAANKQPWNTTAHNDHQHHVDSR